MVTQERLKELLHYCPDTGIFTWRVSKGRAHSGDVAGCVNARGYMQVGIDNDGRRYLLHRLAYLYVHGIFPPDTLDHKDQDKTNNRISNLRLATRKQNSENTGIQSNNTSGIKGVCWHKDGSKWMAQICHHGHRIYLGLFSTIEEASAAYEVTRDTLFTYHKPA